MTESPTLVFVPGAWHQPTCYLKITDILQKQHSLKCIAVRLPSTIGNPLATFKNDIDAVRGAISGETSQGRNVVVIAHSYGGMVGNSAVKGFTPSRDSAPLSPALANAQNRSQLREESTGHVVGIILIASGFTLTGLAFMDPFFGRPPPSWRVNKETGFADIVTPPRELFYHDLPAEEADYWVSQLTPQSLKALFEGGEFAYAGWLDVPSWYIGTVEDRGLPVMAQRMTVGMAREMGGIVEHRELQTSHSPFLSQPEETAGIIVEAVRAFAVGSPGGVPPPSTKEPSGPIVVPQVRIWQPVSWYRFGLPLLFGHMLGRCILIFGWGKRLLRPKSD